MWHASAAPGLDVRILHRGELAMAASPDLPGSTFNRAFGLRQIPIVLPEIRAFFAGAGTTGWVVAGLEKPPWPGAIPEEPTGVHAGPIDDVLGRAGAVRAPAGLAIRSVDPADDDEVRRWSKILVAGSGMSGAEAEASHRTSRFLAGAKGEHDVIASLDGRDVAVAAMFTRRRVAWLGGAAVLPEARGLGIQRALILDRARRAAGSRKALATAAVGSVSASNLEAMGLARIWTRALYRVEPDKAAPADAGRPS
jgi:GNAT superfamily N-acetyltransferase